MPDKIQIDGNALETKQPLSAHDLVKKMVENENFHMTDEDLRNVDTSAKPSVTDEENSKEMAEGLEKDGPQNPYDILGE